MWIVQIDCIAPVIEEVARQYDGLLKVTKVDVDTYQEAARKLAVRSIPTLILFKDGAPVERIVGYQPIDSLAKTISSHL